jgi:hypothetical protein
MARKFPKTSYPFASLWEDKSGRYYVKVVPLEGFPPYDVTPPRYRTSTEARAAADEIVAKMKSGTSLGKVRDLYGWDPQNRGERGPFPGKLPSPSPRKSPKKKIARKPPKLTTSQRKVGRKYVVYGGYGEPLGVLNYGGYEYSDGLWPTEVAEEVYRSKRGSKIRVVPVGNVTDKVYKLAKEVERSGDYRR